MRKPSPPLLQTLLNGLYFLFFDGVTETTDRATSTVKHITPVMVQFYSSSVLITFSTGFKSFKSSEIQKMEMIESITKTK